MALFDFFKKSSEPTYTRSYSTDNEPLIDAYAYSKDPYEYFEKIFEVYFPDYTVGRNVELLYKPTYKVYVPYVLYYQNRPVLGIIMCSTLDLGDEPLYDDYEVQHIMETCERNGFQAQRYFLQFRNEVNYVVNRMTKAINETLSKGAVRSYTTPAPVSKPTPAPAPAVNPAPAPAPAPVPKAGTWTCKCGSVNDSRFCPHCGTPLAWKCSCGRSNDGRFCPDCGTRNPNIRFN